MDTVERTVLQEPVDGAGTGIHHHEKRLGDVERQASPGIYNYSALEQNIRGLRSDLRGTMAVIDNSAVDVPPLRGLSFLDRFLVIWIILAMAIGIILGNLVPSTGPALQKGQFVGVSLPIGTNVPPPTLSQTGC